MVVAIAALSLLVALGLVMYAYYHKCDPLLVGKITKGDQVTTVLIPFLFHYIFKIACIECIHESIQYQNYFIALIMA